MKNIHILPTDKPSRLCIDNSCNELNYSEVEGLNSKHITNQHIYITSDEEINQQTKPCWCINTIKNTWDKDLIYYQGAMPQYHFVGFKKIILTTDQDLIADGIQPIDDDFLEWFVKNPSCEEVEVVDDYKQVNQDNPILKGSTSLVKQYKIIIPKEEPTMVDRLKEYFNNTTEEQINKDWEETCRKTEGIISPTVDDFLEVQKQFSKQETLNLDKLESQLDDSLAKETKESLTNWLHSKRNNQETLEEVTEKIQNECHNFTKLVVPNVSYQDATNTFLFMKLAELTLKLQSYEK